MKNIIALVCILFVTTSAFAQCAGGACYQPVGYYQYQPIQYYYPTQSVQVQGWGEANHTHKCGNCGLLFDHSVNYDPNKTHTCPNCKTGPWNVIESFTAAPIKTVSAPTTSVKATELKKEILIATSSFNIFGDDVKKDIFSIFGNCKCDNCQCNVCNCDK